MHATLLKCCTVILWGMFLQSQLAHSQNADSIIKAHTGKNGRINVDSVIARGKVYFYTNPPLADELARKMRMVAEAQNDPLPLARTYNALGTIYMQIAVNFDSAIHYLGLAEQIFRNQDSKEALIGEGGVNHNYATIYQIKAEYLKAIEHYLDAIKLFEEAGEKKAAPFSNVSTLYALLNDNQQAEKYAREAISVANSAGDEFMEATASINLVDALSKMGRHEETPGPLKVAYDYGIKYNDPYKKLLYHLNHGIYLQKHKNDLPAAIKEFEISVRMADSLADDFEIMRNHAQIAEAYLLNKQYPDAAAAARRTMELAEKLEAKDKQQVGLSVLAQTQAFNQDFSSAYLLMHRAFQLKDSVFDEENQRQVAYLETVFQTEQKEQRISVLEKERILNVIIAMASILALLGIILSLYQRQKRVRTEKELAEQRINQLEKEKQLVATQAVLDGETTERTRLARDLHDGLGSMLSVVKFNLPPLKTGAVLEEEEVQRFQHAIGLLDEFIHELRRVAHHLMPEALVRFGLKASLSDFCSAIPIARFHYFGNEERLPQKLENLIYRCAHELVNNALKHAGATQINAQLIQDSERISFTLEDNGKGFDVDSAKAGMGLKNIRQRVESYKGKFDIYSSGKGTEAIIEIDLT